MSNVSRRLSFLRSTSLRLPKGRRGSVATFVVVALPALIGVAALAIDMGIMTVAAQQVQDTADASALAGAAELPNALVADTTLQQIVAANNENGAWEVEVDPAQDLRYFSPGEEIAGYGVLDDEEYAVEVTAQAQFEFSFARMVGLEEAEVTRKAVAMVALGYGSEELFFAGETKPDKNGIKLDGSGVYVLGGMHSNTKVEISAGGAEVTGVIEYLHDCDLHDSVDIETEESVVKPYPVDYQWSDFDRGPWDYVYDKLKTNAASLPSGRYRIHGDLVLNASTFSCNDCLFVVDGKIDFNGCSPSLERVTLIAAGQIKVNGGTRKLSCLEEGLFAMSLNDDADGAIVIDGASTHTYGVVYAPNGGIVYNGASQEIHHGGMVGLRIKVNGSSSSYLCSDDEFAVPSKVRLVR